MKKALFLFCFFLIVSGIFASGKKEIVYGDFKIIPHENTGNFSLYFMNDKNTDTYTSLFDSNDQSLFTSYALKVGKKLYDLRPGVNTRVVAEEMPDGLRLTYYVEEIVEVAITLTVLKNENDIYTDEIEFEAKMTNTGKTSNSFAFKGVFDTYLGEDGGNHFSTLLKKSINSEAFYADMSYDKWVVSSDGENSLLFLLDGAQVTSPQQITFAARDQFTRRVWQPIVQTGRSYNTSRVLNNSAMQITWRPLRLNPGSSGTIRFYMSAATNGEEPNADIARANDNSSGKTADQIFIDSAGAEVRLRESKLDSEYIAALLQRIYDLENDSEGIDLEEIDRINAELDEILEQLEN